MEREVLNVESVITIFLNTESIIIRELKLDSDIGPVNQLESRISKEMKVYSILDLERE